MKTQISSKYPWDPSREPLGVLEPQVENHCFIGRGLESVQAFCTLITWRVTTNLKPLNMVRLTSNQVWNVAYRFKRSRSYQQTCFSKTQRNDASLTLNLQQVL